MQGQLKVQSEKLRVIKTSESNTIKPFLQKLYIPPKDSHKGQNGRVLIIGGSSLFHAASIWGAEVASYFTDLVHYSSTEENAEIFLTIKKKFKNGIVIPKKELPFYVEEDDSVLVGLGMVRGEISQKIKVKSGKWEDILEIEDEPTYTRSLVKFLIENFPKKRFIFDAGALQMMEAQWLLKLKERPILTPHQGEFLRLFGEDVSGKNTEKKAKTVQACAKKFNCVILLKSIVDIVSNGKDTFIIEGGNPGLTKGGTGDILAGMTAALYAKNKPEVSAVLASFLLKKTAEELFSRRGYWYNIGSIVDSISETLFKVVRIV